MANLTVNAAIDEATKYVKASSWYVYESALPYFDSAFSYFKTEAS